MSDAVIYCRVSTKEQTQNLSLSTQEKQCRDYCARQGWNAARVFVEEGESAKTADRAQFQRALSYCRENKARVDYFVVYSLSRFSRDRHDHVVVAAHLNSLGVKLRSATETIDDTSQGKLMEGLLATFAQFDNDVRAERTKAGMRAAAERGRWCHNAPIGYLNPPDRKQGASLLPDPARAHLVRMAFDLYARGNLSKRDVIARTSAAGLRNKAGKPLSDQHFTKMLTNPVYAGRIETKVGVRGVGDWEPIVSGSVFDSVQAVLHGRGYAVEARIVDNPIFPLRRFARCGHCGVALTGAVTTKANGREYAYYRCTTAGCTTGSVSPDIVHERFASVLTDFTPSRGAIRLFQRVVLDAWKLRQSTSQDGATMLRKRLVELEAKKTKLLSAHLYDETIDAETFSNENARLGEEIALVRIELHRVEVDVVDVDGLLAYAEALLCDLAKAWRTANASQRLRLQAALFPDGVLVDEERVWNPEKSSALNPLWELRALQPTVVTPRRIELLSAT